MSISKINSGFLFLLIIVLLGFSARTATAQTTAFTYQGKLVDSGNLANGNYDLQFKLFDTVTVGTGTQQGSTVTVSNVIITNGIFTVQLDFGACANCFNGANRFLEISMKPTSGGSFTTLGPRQPVTSNPYAIKSLNAANATTADGLSVACISCVTSSQIQSVNGSAVTGQIPVASVPAGSGNYVQNTTSQQAATNFNISGNGTAGGTLAGNIVNATTQFNLGGQRILSTAGSNLFAGPGAGQQTIGGSNSFFGVAVGIANTTGDFNSFFGFQAGLNNNFGRFNSFFGVNAGSDNTTGISNSFFGVNAGNNNSTGDSNTFIGDDAGLTNSTGSYNTAIGAFADVSAGSLDHATAIGSGAVASLSNSIYLGRTDGSDAVRIPGPVVINGSLVVGTLGSAGSMSICLNIANRIAPCSSSLRYKNNVQTFTGGLDIVRRLRPITFNWKDGGMSDVGFAAEEVQAIAPLLATYNKDGQIEGVKYGQLTTVLVNAVKEQQTQIEAQRQQLRDREQQGAQQQQQLHKQQQELEVLKQWYCRTHPKAALCHTAQHIRR